MINPFEEMLKEINELKSLLINFQNTKDYSPRYMLYHDAADYLSISTNALRVMVSKGQIKSCKKLGKRYFLLDDLIQWIESGRDVLNEEYAEDILVKN